jgi:hypothetical protein
MGSILNKRILYVHESINTPNNCSSIITDKPNIPAVLRMTSYVDTKSGVPTNHTNKGPFSILELESYIMTEMNEFVRALQAAGKCKAAPNQACTAYFSNLDGSYPTYKVPIPAGADAEKYVLKNRRQLCWRSFELLIMLITFQSIIRQIQKTSTTKSDDPAIREIFNSVGSLRTSVEQQVRDLKEGKNGLTATLTETRDRTDVTVYTSVLWGVLATTLIFYWIKTAA